MWSRSNTISMIFVALATTLVCLYARGWGYTIVQHIGISTDFTDITISAAIILSGGLAMLCGADLPVVLIIGTLGVFVSLTLAQDALVRYLSLAAVLFSIGVYGMVVSRNAVRVLMSIELMLNAVNINLVAFARYVDPNLIRGQLFAIFILTVAAAEAAVGLAIVLAVYRNMSTVDMERFNLLKW